MIQKDLRLGQEQVGRLNQKQKTEITHSSSVSLFFTIFEFSSNPSISEKICLFPGSFFKGFVESPRNLQKGLELIILL